MCNKWSIFVFNYLKSDLILVYLGEGSIQATNIQIKQPVEHTTGISRSMTRSTTLGTSTTTVLSFEGEKKENIALCENKNGSSGLRTVTSFTVSCTSGC